jgi:hypothetical protein
MKKAYPAHLPGKEVWSIHFSPEAAGKLTPQEIAQEINPLWDLGVRKKWITPEEADRYKTDLLRKNMGNAWKAAIDWSNRINWHRPEESHAAAGWLVLKNLTRAWRIWVSFRKPFQSLQTPTLGTIERGIKFTLMFEGFLDPQHQEKDRLILAAMILMLPDLDQKALGREMIGAPAIDVAHDPFLRRLAISHGAPLQAPNPPGSWGQPSLSKVRTLIDTLQNRLSPEQKEWIANVTKP